ncbi:hypothetical protein AB0451_03630 [Streptomyces sp. NPDC052000]|uniref:hypothetical protein n=1 Tax=Streptomyces sp. NPDC052000 TaxID=3155676 RepID=UPI00344B329E
MRQILIDTSAAVVVAKPRVVITVPAGVVIVEALAWEVPVVTSPADMEPTMVTRHITGGLARHRVIYDAAAGMPTPRPSTPPPGRMLAHR